MKDEAAAKRKVAAQLLAKCDQKKKELRETQEALNRACAEYGRAKGVWGFHPEHLRIELTHEKEKTGGQEN